MRFAIVGLCIMALGSIGTESCDGTTSTDRSRDHKVSGDGEVAELSSGSLVASTEVSFEPNDEASTPLVGVVRATTDVTSVMTITVSGGGEEWVVGPGIPASVHEQAILGLMPDTSYAVSVTLSNRSSSTTVDPLEWRTPELPGDFPPLELVRAEPSRMEPGMTLFCNRDPVYFIVVDDQGQVRWIHGSEGSIDDHRLLSNGNLIYVDHRQEIIELDWRGKVVAGWYPADFPGTLTPSERSVAVSVGSMHHSIHEMPNGNLLALSHEVRTIEGYPTSTTDPQAPRESTPVVGDVVVEFTRAGELVNQVSLLDVLDPTRVTHLSLSDSSLGRDPNSKDWSHSNSAVYDPDTDSYVVSLRHQDAVVKIRRETGELVWILGSHENWGEAWQEKLLEPVGELEWQFQQHAAELVPGGLGLYDNGKYRAAAYEPLNTPSYSRAVRFEIDEDAMTVSQAWSFGAKSGPDSFYASSMSDADWQPVTGNVLITSGTLSTAEDPVYRYTQILEVDPQGERVFELLVRDEAGDDVQDYATFGGERIPDIRH